MKKKKNEWQQEEQPFLETFVIVHYHWCESCETLEHATTGDHVIAVTADFQACPEDGSVSQIVRQRTLAATAALTLA